MSTEEKIKVMQAYVDGKDIEFILNGRWVIAKSPSWDWEENTYRIKPENPKFEFRGHMVVGWACARGNSPSSPDLITWGSFDRADFAFCSDAKMFSPDPTAPLSEYMTLDEAKEYLRKKFEEKQL